MRTFEQNYTGIWPIQVVGKLFRVIAADGPVDVRLYRNGYPIADALSVGVGYWVRPAEGYDRIDITSAVVQTVKVGVGDGDGGYDAMTIVGDVKTSIKQGTECNQLAPVTVGTVATQLCAASAIRRELRIRNAGTSPIYIGGADVTVAGGAIEVSPGSIWIETTGAGLALYAISAVGGQSVRLQEIR